MFFALFREVRSAKVAAKTNTYQLGSVKTRLEQSAKIFDCLKELRVNFEEFKNQSRLYVIGALEPEELEEFEGERKKCGKKGEDFIIQCYALHESFTLSVRTAAVSAVKERVMAKVRERKQVTNGRNPADTALIAASK